jgi:hypothetical protein
MGWKNLAETLAKRFGLGAMPLISRRLYGRLQREAERHGEPVMRIIGECAESASCAQHDKGAWFRKSVSLRLREHGYLLTKHQEQQQAQIAELRSKVLAAVGSDSSARKGG